MKVQEVTLRTVARKITWWRFNHASEWLPRAVQAIKVHIDRNVESYRPEKAQVHRDGDEVED
jgi:hypothetical protein